MPMPGFLLRVLPLLGLAAQLACSGGGRGEQERASRPNPASVEPKAKARHAPPIKPFVAPEPWKPRGDGAAVAPPDLAQETWRAMANQYSPHQKKTPRWQPLPAREAVELTMPAGSRFRCVVSPIEVSPRANEVDTELLGWSLLRRMACSSDGFVTWTEHGHRVRLSPDGTREVRFDADARLRERGDDGEARETAVRIRADEEQRAATKGPPRIMPGVPVDDD